MEWFRWFEGTATDPKFHLLARKSGQPAAFVLAVWAMLLERASQSEERGCIDGFDCESADAFLGMPDGAARAIMDAMKEKSMIDDERVCKWNQRQPVREDGGAAERKRRQREREKEQRHAESRDVTQCHAESRDVATDEIREDKKQDLRIKYTPLAPHGGEGAGEAADASACGEEDEPKPRRTRFVPPGADDVQAYCDERRNGVNGQEFCDFYASKGWKVGNTPMKDWRAAVRTWERGRTGGARASPSSPPMSWEDKRDAENRAAFLRETAHG